ncbi:AAA family ATPase [Bengtsoniella intestinalis]|uniref:AAA family ATPase n=1 Tax=Bengtsoniella intestinalis TaxID=3073143 RepID=UPI00391F577A
MILQSKMQAVMQDVALHITEREELIELIAIALLTRKNLFVLGEPGQAKSYAINLFRSRIHGANQFERLLSKQSDEEQLFGRIDLNSLIPGSVAQQVLDQDSTYQTLIGELSQLQAQIASNPTDATAVKDAQLLTEKLEQYRKMLSILHRGEPQLITTGKIPEAHIVFLDEAFKCNDGVLNSLLTALNERKYTNEGRTYPIPTISFFAASNEIPNFNDPSEKILEALYDRLELKLVTENIEARDHRISAMVQKQQGGQAPIGSSITLDELGAMQQEVFQVSVPLTIHQLMDDICCALRQGGIKVSDRKLLNYAPVVQAKAWLCGRSGVISTDLLALEGYLWQKPTDRQLVRATLERLCINPLQDKANNIHAMASEVLEQFEQSVAEPTDNDTENRKQQGKALHKFRSEMVRLYRAQMELAGTAQSDNETTLVGDLLADLERINQKAHTATGFTPIPLEQLEMTA